jgi:hypothetical protein
VIVCFDPSAKGIEDDPARIVRAFDVLNVERESLVAIPSPEDSQGVWAALKRSLNTEQIISKETIGRKSPIPEDLPLAAVVDQVMSRRTAGTQAIQYELLTLSGKIGFLETQGTARFEVLESRLSAHQKAISEDVDELKSAIAKLNYSIFPRQDLSGQPTLVTMLQDSRGGIASLMKDVGKIYDTLDKLNGDIGAVAQLSKQRLGDLRVESDERVTELLERLQELRGLMDDQATQQAQKNLELAQQIGQLQDNKEMWAQVKKEGLSNLFKMGSYMVLILLGIAIVLVLGFVAPDLLQFAIDVFRAVLD